MTAESEKRILPIGLLMKEHRVIEKMISLISEQIEDIEKGEDPDTSFLAQAVDFIRWYADRCHHGKEEDILFDALTKKNIKDEHRETIDQLISEHKYGRETVAGLVKSLSEFEKRGDKGSRDGIVDRLKDLVAFYPKHIEKEDKRFFFPSMEYFNTEEKNRMLDDFASFDRNMVHEKYKHLVEERSR